MQWLRPLALEIGKSEYVLEVLKDVTPEAIDAARAVAVCRMSVIIRNYLHFISPKTSPGEFVAKAEHCFYEIIIPPRTLFPL